MSRAAALLLLAGAFFAGLSPGTAEAQDSVLVSNRGQQDSTNPVTVRGPPHSVITAAQQFTTGSNSAGYTLSGVELETTSGGNNLSAFIYSSSNGLPGDSLHTLTRDSTGTGVKTYAAPTGATLAASTSYFVVFGESSDLTRLQSTTRYDEDQGAASMWSINNARHFKVGSGSWTSDTSTVIEIAIRGAAIIDNTAPSLSAASVKRATLKLTYDEALDSNSVPAASAFTVTVDGSAVALAGTNPVAIGGRAVTLNLDLAVAPGATVTVSYTAPGTNPIQDEVGIDAGNLSNQAVTNATPGVLLSVSSLTVAEGGTGTYTVELATAPSGNVTVTIASGNTNVTVDTDAGTTGDQSALTFTTANWSTARTVTVSAAEDDDTADDSATLAHAIAGASEYDSLTDPTLAVTVTDNDDDTTEMPMTGTALVSNLGQTANDSGYPTSGWRQATQFTTGSNALGYVVQEMVINVVGTNTIPGQNDPTPVVQIWTSDTESKPGSSLFTMNSIGRISGPGNSTFTAPANSTLAADTDYFIVVDRLRGDNDGNFTGGATDSGNEDSGGADDWSIGSNRFFQLADTTTWSPFNGTIMFSVRGTVAGADTTAPTLSTTTPPAVNGATLTLTYGEALDSGSTPAAGDFTVTVAGMTRALAGTDPVSVSGSAVTLTLASAVAPGATVTVSYTAGTNPIRDGAGNNAAALTDRAVTNSTPGLLLSATALTVAESGSGTYTMALAAQPSGNVTVAITSSDDNVVTIDDTDNVNTGIQNFLTFTTSDWSTAQTVTVQAEDDADAVNDSVTLTHTISGATEYDSLADPTLAVTVTENDKLAGAPSISSVTAGTAQLMVAWSAPADPGYSDGTDGSHTDNTVTAYDVRHILTSATDKSDGHWTVVEDAWTSGNLEYAIEGLTAGQSYDVQVRALTDAGVGPWSATSTGTPRADTTAPTLSTTTPPSVNGNTLTLTYGEALDTGSVPASSAFTVEADDTEVALATSNAVAVSGSAVTLTLASAVAPGATVTVSYTAGTNPIRDGAGNNAAALTDRAVTNSTPGLLLSATTLTVAEGASGTYTVRLATEPSASVTVTITSNDSDVTVDTDDRTTGNQDALTFAPRDWSTARTVTVRAAEDDDTANDSATLTHAISGASEYASLADPTLAVTVTDNDTADTTDTSAPTGFRAEPDNRTVNLFWTAPTGSVTSGTGAVLDTVSEYIVEWGATASLGFSIETGNTGTEYALLQFVHLGISNGAAVYVRVRARFTDGTETANGSPSPTLKATPGTSTSAPARADAPTVTGGDGALAVTWTAPGDGGNTIVKYDLRHKESTATAWTTVDAAWALGGGALAYDIEGLTNGTQYDVQVRAVSNAGDGAWSPTATGTPSAAPATNAAPAFGAANYTFTLAENADGSGETAVAVGTVSASDANIGDTVEYSITAGNTGSVFAIGASDGAITYVGDGEDHETTASFTLTVRASDGMANTDVTVTVNVTDVNEAPVFSGSATFTVEENSVAIGTVAAFDPDRDDMGMPADPVRYTEATAGDFDLFAVDFITGAVTFTPIPGENGIPRLDFENGEGSGEGNNTYTYRVTATGGTGGRIQTATREYSITVTNVDAPAAPGAPTVVATADSTTSLDVSWTAPAGQVTDYDLQYRAGTSGDFTAGPQGVTGTSSAIGSLTAGTAYQVQVRASNFEGAGAWSTSRTGSTTADTTVPSLSTAVVNGAALTLTYGEALDMSSVPASGDYTVTVAGAAASLAGTNPVAVSGSTVTLTLASAVTAGQTVTVSYTAGTNPVQDAAGNDAGNLSSQAVTNATPGVVLSVSTLTIAEGGSAEYTIVANTNAGAIVWVNLASDNSDVTVRPPSVSLWGNDWRTPQRITVTAAQDADGAHETATITHTPNPGNAHPYHTVDIGDVSVRVTDDEASANSAPPAPSVRGQFATAERAFSYQFAAVTDPDGDGVSYAAALDGGGSLPDWLTFTAATRTFSGTPAADDVGALRVRVTATDDGSPAMSASATFTLTVEEYVPRNFRAQALSGRIRYTWSAPRAGDVGSYQIRYSTDSTFPSDSTTTTFAIDDAAATSHDVRDLANGTMYFSQIRVKDNSDDVTGPWSYTVEAKPDTNANRQPPAAPAAPTVTAGDGQLTVSWRAPEDNGNTIVAYHVRYIRSDATDKSDSAWTAPGGDEWRIGRDTALSYTIAGLTNGESYDVQVSAASSIGNGGWSATTAGTPAAPAAVDTTAPALNTTAVNGAALVLTYNEALDTNSTPAASAFTVTTTGDPSPTVSSVSVASSAVTLTLSAAVAAGQTVTVSYAVPSSNPIQDAAGNDAAALTNQAVTNATPGIVLSTFELTVAEGGSANYTVRLNTQPDNDVTVTVARLAGGSEDVTFDTSADSGVQPTLTFSRTTWSTPQTVMVSAATDTDTENDAATLTHTASGGGYASHTASLSVMVTDAGDVTAPALSTASVNGAALVLTYNENLDTGSTPATGDFTVTVAGSTRTVSNVVVASSAVTLTLSSAVVAGDAVTVSYTAGTNPIRDATENIAGNLSNQAVINNTLGIAYTGTLAEAAANDGSITGSIVATLTGDTFTANVVSANHVSASNVPAGLTASFTRTSDTKVTLTLTGSATNHANANDISNLTITFADGAFTNEAASTVAGSSKSDIAVDFRDASSIAYAGGFAEAAANGGSVTGSVVATLTGDTFAAAVSGTAAAGVSATNVPSGLTAVLTRTSDTKVTLTLTGSATSHANADDVSNLTITFTDDAFANEAASRVGGTSKSDIVVDFTDASSIAYTGTLAEAAANDGSITGSIVATLTGDTFTANVVSANHVSASNVPAGLTASFTRTSDTKVTLTLTGSATNHANANDISNLTITFADGAFTNEAASTVAGSSKSDIAVDFRDASSIAYAGGFAEAAANDGSVTGSVVATLTGDTFAAAVSGTAAAGVSATNVPSGLTAVLTRTSDTKVTLTLTGSATNHANADDVSNLTITFTDDAFANEAASTVAGSSKSDIAVDFRDASSIAYAGGFAEAAANDGSVTGSVVATLTGDTFAAAASGTAAAGVSATNVPSGLTAVLTRTSDTKVTLTLTGSATSHANADDVSNLTITFTDDAFANEAASTVAGSSKSDIAVDFRDASSIAYAGGFAEAAANDGSVTGSVVATLTGDTFAAAASGTAAAGVSATNVPSGLTAVLTRTSDTKVTLTLTGSATSHANADDVSNLTITFTDDAFANEAASRVGGTSKSDIVVDFTDASSIAYTGTLAEAAANDGSITGSIVATLTGDTFTANVVSANHVSASNVPAGLTASFTRTSDTKVTLTLTGSATNHANANDISNLTITFADGAFTNEAASTVAGSSKSDIAVDFRDASSIAYAGGFAEAAANDGSVTGSVVATLTGDTFAAAVSGTAAAGVSATNVPSGLTAVLTRTSDTKVTLTLTGSATSHANADDVSNLTITFTDDAFANEAASRVGGTSKSDIVVDFTDASSIAYTGTLAEAAANDGSITGSIVATLTGDTFTANVVSANHVSASNVPAGLTASFTRTSDTKVTLTLTGSATNHANANDISNLTITFADGAFTNEAASTVAGSSKSDIAVDFRDASSIAYAGGFAEAAANDGSVTGSVVATLTGDTFAAAASGTAAAGVSATNVPSGLTAVLTRTSDTKVTLTLTGSATSHANADDVSNLTITFTDDAFANEAASRVGGTSKSDIVVDFTDASSIAYTGTLAEAAANDGSITGSIVATLTGDTFTANVVSANHVSASNVPAGLTASFTRTSDTKVTLTLTGSATNHANANDISNLTITFADGAFTNEAASTVAGSSKSDIAVDFRDASSIAYAGGFAEAAANGGSVTGSVVATLTGDTFAAAASGTAAAGVSATNVPSGLTAVLTRTSDTKVTLTLTGSATSHANADDVSNLTITFTDDAFANEAASRVGGTSKSDIVVDFTDASSIAYTGTLAEAAANDGSITGSIVATLTGDTFTANVVSANHVSASNVPAGLTASFTRTSDTKVTLTLTGSATNHANANDISNLTITFADGAFTNEAASTVAGSSKSDIAVDFRDASSIAYAGGFAEAAANDGSVTGSVVATLTGDTFAAAVSGTAAAGVSATNVPSGLTAVLTRTSATRR